MALEKSDATEERLPSLALLTSSLRSIRLGRPRPLLTARLCRLCTWLWTDLNELLDPHPPAAEMILYDLDRGSAEGQVLRVVHAQHRVLKFVVRLESPNDEAIDLLKLLDPNRSSMSSVVVVRILRTEAFGNRPRPGLSISLRRIRVRMSQHVVGEPRSNDLLRQLNLLVTELDQTARVGPKDRRPSGHRVDVPGENRSLLARSRGESREQARTSSPRGRE